MIEYMLCPKCDSHNIVRDAWTKWDPILGEWTIDDLWSIYCHDCLEPSDWAKVVTAIEGEPNDGNGIQADKSTDIKKP